MNEEKSSKVEGLVKEDDFLWISEKYMAQYTTDRTKVGQFKIYQGGFNILQEYK